jgi:hypothetical protein
MDIRYSYRGAPTIKAFSESDAFVRGLMGPFGSGKSSGCIVEIIKRAHNQAPGRDGIRRTRWAVVRNTYQQLRDTTIKTFHHWLPPHLFGKWHKTEHVYEITGFDGVHLEVMFRALDRPDQVGNLLSLELSGVWVNEAREVPYTIIKALQGRVGRFPAKIDGGCSWYGLIADTNPPDSDSWWYTLFEERRPANVEVFKQPSGLSPDAENKENLPPNYYENLLASYDTETAKVYVHGEYGFVTDGKPVYPEYNDNLHCSDKVSLIPGVEVDRGWDFGLTPACIISQMTPKGQWLIIDEVVAEDMGIERFADEVLRHCAENYPNVKKWVDTGDPAGNSRSETDEKTCFQIMKAKGINVEPGEQTPTIRIESVKKPLNYLVGGQPAFLMHPRCKVLRKGFQGGYQFRRKKVSGEHYTDVPDKNKYSHPHDGAQYTATRHFAHMLTRPRYEEDEEEAYDDTGRSSVGGY